MEVGNVYEFKKDKMKIERDSWRVIITKIEGKIIHFRLVDSDSSVEGNCVIHIFENLHNKIGV